MRKSQLLFLSRTIIILIAVVLLSQYPGIAGNSFVEIDDDSVILPLISNSFIFEKPSENSIIHGIVSDGRSDQRVDGAEVCLNGDQLCDHTNINGEYEIDEVFPGEYTFSVEHQSYPKFSQNLNLQADTTIQHDIQLYPILTEGQWRVIVTWDPTPTWPPDDTENDLNLHLWIRNFDPPNYHIFEGNLGNCQNLFQDPGACYENEERLGGGPDVIVISENTDYVYSFAVLNYNAAEIGVPPITDLDVLVQVFDETGLRAEYDLEDLKAETGDLWYVFDISDEKIVSQHCLLQYEQTGEVPPACP